MSERIPRGARVDTPNGPGQIVSHELRKNTNGGPGCWEYRVRLDDGRIRHYKRRAVSRLPTGGEL